MNIIFIILVAAAIYSTIKNYQVLKRHKSYKQYVTLIDPLYEGSTSTFLDLADSYMESEKLIEFVNKALILKTFALVREKNSDSFNCLSQIDLKEIFLNKKDNPDKTKLLLNSDSFFWLLLIVIEAQASGQIKVINKMKEFLLKYNDSLSNQLYYQMILHYIEVCLGNNEKLSFFNAILDGDYAQYSYSKDLIGIFKRVAAAILVYNKVEIKEEDKNQLSIFAKGQAGKYVLTRFNMLDEYSNEVV